MADFDEQVAAELEARLTAQGHTFGADVCAPCWAEAERRASQLGGRPEDHYAAVVVEVEAA